MRFLLGIFLFCSSAMAQDIGFDLLGVQFPKFDCDEAEKLFERQLSLGTLLGTFDEFESLGCFTRLLQSGRVDYVRVHLANGSCVNNGNCGGYELLRGFSPKSLNSEIERGNARILRQLARRAASISEHIARVSPGLPCGISGINEHQLSRKAATIVAETIRKAAPKCDVVNAPLKHSAPRIPETIHELHNEPVNIQPPCIVSMDGTKASELNVPFYLERYKQCRVFIWDQFLNIRVDGKFVDPRKRTAVPTKEQFKQLREYVSPRLRNIEVSTRDLRNCTSILLSQDGAGGFVWKVSDHARPGKQTVLLFPPNERYKRVRIVHQGKLVDELRECGIANGNRQHWCSNKKAKETPSMSVVKGIRDKVVTCRTLVNPRTGRID